VPNNSCLLICLYQKAAPVGCACCRNATDYGSLPSLNLFFSTTISNIVLSLFFFCFFFQTWRANEMFRLQICPRLSWILHIIRIQQHIKKVSHSIFYTNGKQSECGRILYFAAPFRPKMDWRDVNFWVCFFERAVSFNGYCPLSLSLPLFWKKKKSSEVIKLVGAGLQTLKTSCSKDSFLLHSQQRDCFVVALGPLPSCCV
jgi:hypothetical protein